MLPFLFIAYALVISAVIIVAIDLRRRKNCNEPTVATVICLEEFKRVGKPTIYKPLIEYYVKGAVYTERSVVGHYPPKYREGERINIYYDPNEPYKYRTESDVLRIVAIALFALAIVFFVVSIKFRM